MRPARPRRARTCSEPSHLPPLRPGGRLSPGQFLGRFHPICASLCRYRAPRCGALGWAGVPERIKGPAGSRQGAAAVPRGPPLPATGHPPHRPESHQEEVPGPQPPRCYFTLDHEIRPGRAPVSQPQRDRPGPTSKSPCTQGGRQITGNNPPPGSWELNSQWEARWGGTGWNPGRPGLGSPVSEPPWARLEGFRDKLTPLSFEGDPGQ